MTLKEISLKMTELLEWIDTHSYSHPEYDVKMWEFRSLDIKFENMNKKKSWYKPQVNEPNYYIGKL
jgi:hypothetical protein